MVKPPSKLQMARDSALIAEYVEVHVEERAGNLCTLLPQLTLCVSGLLSASFMMNTEQTTAWALQWTSV